MTVALTWRGGFEDREVGALHADAFGHAALDEPWRARLERHSLGWVCAREGDELVGFVNVVWDGGIHAFVLDTIVTTRLRRRGVGRRMVALAANEARRAGCEWLHVDFEDHLRAFYLEACGFAATPAGLIALRGSMPTGP